MIIDDCFLKLNLISPCRENVFDFIVVVYFTGAKDIAAV
jgi:hypothetical protein